jgi:AAA+ superfamily predicted ATPase
MFGHLMTIGDRVIVKLNCQADDECVYIIRGELRDGGLGRFPHLIGPGGWGTFPYLRGRTSRLIVAGDVVGGLHGASMLARLIGSHARARRSLQRIRPMICHGRKCQPVACTSPHNLYWLIVSTNNPDESVLQSADLVHLVQLAAAGNAPGSNALLRRMARKYRADQPAVAKAIVTVLRESPLRSASSGNVLDQPVDSETRLALVREEDPVILANEPILPETVERTLRQIVSEHREIERLLEVGLAPTRTALFVGAPGVGKTLTARWIARELGVPLLVLDLSSVMSSFLGKTGTNLRRVLDYAKTTQAVLLLDELDAVAKRRDDATEIGELKRLVTVLLQEIDSWPEGSLLLGATNHSELLDPAVWRRFEVVVDFPAPDKEAMAVGIRTFLDDPAASPGAIDMLARVYEGETLNNVERDILRARRTAALNGSSAIDALLLSARERFDRLASGDRVKAAARLVRETDLSQRAVHEITGVSRDTLRKYSQTTTTGDNHA